jgi:hypothetical protein
MATCTAAPAWAPAPPRFITYGLGGRDIRKVKGSDELTAINDKKKGYYLVTETDGKEAYSLLLIKPRELKDDPRVTEGELKLRAGTLTLSTAHGVKIGDSERDVIRKLGKPTDRDPDAALGELTLFYNYIHGRIYGWSYASWYSFRKGKVAAILISFQKGNEVAG